MLCEKTGTDQWINLTAMLNRLVFFNSQTQGYCRVSDLKCKMAECCPLWEIRDPITLYSAHVLSILLVVLPPCVLDFTVVMSSFVTWSTSSWFCFVSVHYASSLTLQHGVGLVCIHLPTTLGKISWDVWARRPALCLWKENSVLVLLSLLH